MLCLAIYAILVGLVSAAMEEYFELPKGSVLLPALLLFFLALWFILFSGAYNEP